MRHAWDRRLGVWWIAEDTPERMAVVSSPSGETLTYGELAGRAHQLVHALRARGVGAGDIVAYALPNGIETVLWQLAAQESGLLSISLNPAFSSAEIRTIVEHSGAKVLVVSGDIAAREDALTEGTASSLLISVGGGAPGFLSQDELVAGHPTTPVEDRVLGGPITYSSGTTGKPKAIWRQIPKADPSVAADAMKQFAQAFQMHPFDGVHLVSAGMHHGGCQGYYLSALAVGQALAIMGKYDAEEALATIQRHAVTTAYMVPTQFVRLLKLPAATREAYNVSSLKVVVHSAAPCPADVKRRMFDWWGPVIWETYGGMEGAATIAKPHRWLEKPGTVGRTVKGVTLRILDDDGNPVPAGEVGHVYIEREGQTFAYAGDPELTASVHRGRAFTLGDIGYVDADGYLFLCDRAKDMIISGGVNIYPAEAEGVLTAHPAVEDVAVIGVPDPEWGEQVRAVVQLTAGHQPSDELADQLLGYCREHLASYKCPRTLEFRESLPRTDSGKLQKRKIRDEFWVAAGRKL